MSFKKIANQMLTTVFLLFLLAAVLKHYYPGSTAVVLAYVCLEAALIGGIADWFAVTALFGRPLGVAWHTELIPRNRERIAHSLTEAVEKDLLSVTAIRKRLSGINFVEIFIHWVDHYGGQKYLSGVFARHGKAVWDAKDMQAMAGCLEGLLRRNADAVDSAALFNTLLNRALERGKGEKLVDFILEEMITLVQKPSFRQAVFRYMEALKHKKTRSLLEKAVVWLGEQTDSINVEEAANALCDELMSLLKDLTDSDHLVRQWITAKLTAITGNLENNHAWQAAIDGWKLILVKQLQLTGTLDNVVAKTADGSYEPAGQWLARQVHIYWDIFKKDKALKGLFEARIKYAIYRLLKKEHHLIGLVVRSVLGSFSNSDLSRFVEEKAGQDLQWIRINGSIVGGIVGLILYLFLHTLYEPYIIPVIRSWTG